MPLPAGAVIVPSPTGSWVFFSNNRASPGGARVNVKRGTGMMWQRIKVSIAGILLAALLPVNAGAYGFAGYPADRNRLSYAGSPGGNHFQGSLRVQTGKAGDGYYVRARLDGLSPGNVHVYLRRNRLVLEVAQGGRTRQQDRHAAGTSQWQMRVHRQLRLPCDADTGRMTQRINNGVLEIYIPVRNRRLPGGPRNKW